MDSGVDHSEYGVEHRERAALKRWAGYRELGGLSQESGSPEGVPEGQKRGHWSWAVGEGGWSPDRPQRQGARGLPVRLGAGSLNSAVP